MALAFLSFLSPTTWVLIITTCVLFAMYSIWPYTIFKKMGVPGPKPLPLFGNFLHYRKGMAQFDEQCRKCYGGMWGIYEGRYPMLMVTDPEIVKTVLVKEFYTLFTNRRNFKMSGILDDAVSVVEDDTWKRIRSILSPTFSTGKLKEMVPIIKHYTNILVEHLRQRESQSLEAKRVFGSYSMDVIASAAFSTQVDSLNNENDPFIKNINKLMKFSFLNPLVLLIFLFPVVVPVLQFFKVSFLSSSILHFFNSNLQRMKKTRSKGKHSGRVDFLQLMIDAQITETVKDEEGTDTPYKSLTDNEIQAQAIIFIIAGTETTANTLSYVAYNLAVHPDIQSKLQEEIDEAFPNKESSRPRRSVRGDMPGHQVGLDAPFHAAALVHSSLLPENLQLNVRGSSASRPPATSRHTAARTEVQNVKKKRENCQRTASSCDIHNAQAQEGHCSSDVVFTSRSDVIGASSPIPTGQHHRHSSPPLAHSPGSDIIGHALPISMSHLTPPWPITAPRGMSSVCWTFMVMLAGCCPIGSAQNWLPVGFIVI
uniref:cytochrome P450 3A30-like n=1 Tax=Myxine glutinosa TaxID=7769 RepID=UPI00358F6841